MAQTLTFRLFFVAVFFEPTGSQPVSAYLGAVVIGFDMDATSKRILNGQLDVPDGLHGMLSWYLPSRPRLAILARGRAHREPVQVA